MGNFLFNLAHKGIFIVVIVVIVVAIGGLILVGEDSGGVVTTKWTEVSTSRSCDDDGNNCTTSTTTHYYVQLRDGRVYLMFFGWVAWQSLQTDQYISLHSQGIRWEPLGLRIFTPYITSYNILEDPRR